MSRENQSHKISLFKAAPLLIFCPRSFVRASFRHDRALRFNQPRMPQRANHTRKLRNALATGAGLVFISAAIGGVTGLLLSCVLGTPSQWLISILQALAGAILLWATLSFLGWEI